MKGFFNIDSHQAPLRMLDGSLYSLLRNHENPRMRKYSVIYNPSHWVGVWEEYSLLIDKMIERELLESPPSTFEELWENEKIKLFLTGEILKFEFKNYNLKSPIS